MANTIFWFPRISMQKRNVLLTTHSIVACVLSSLSPKNKRSMPYLFRYDSSNVWLITSSGSCTEPFSGNVYTLFPCFSRRFARNVILVCTSCAQHYTLFTVHRNVTDFLQNLTNYSNGNVATKNIIKTIRPEFVLFEIWFFLFYWVQKCVRIEDCFYLFVGEETIHVYREPTHWYLI